MKNCVSRTFIIAVAALVLIAPSAFGQTAVKVGKKGEVELSTDVRFGPSMLTPGHYQLQHQSVDGQHFLVVRPRTTVRTSPRTHYGGATGDEIARVPCRVVPTPAGKKTWETALYTKLDADGVRSFTRVDVRGETEGHVVTLEPQQ